MTQAQGLLRSPQRSSVADTAPREDIFLCIALKLSSAKCHPITAIVDHPDYSADVYCPQFSFCACHHSVWGLLTCRDIPSQIKGPVPAPPASPQAHSSPCGGGKCVHLGPDKPVGKDGSREAGGGDSQQIDGERRRKYLLSGLRRVER